MKSVAKAGLLLALVMLVAAPLAAADKEKKGKKKGARGNAITANLIKQVKKADLTEEQSQKVKAIVAEYQPQLAAAQKKVGLTADQRKAGAEARKKAADDGKKGKAVQEAVAAAQNLSDEQKEAQEALRGLTMKFRAAVVAVLTPEQRKAAGIRGGNGKGKKKKKENA